MSTTLLDTESSTLPRPASEESGREQLRMDRAAILESFRRVRLSVRNIDWTVLSWMLVMHGGAVAAPFFFTWSALATAIFLHWLTCSIGVCLGYHRTLSHGSLRLAAPVRFVVTLCGVLSGEGSPLSWAATHRVHHGRSDQEGDPHSPREGFLWSHILWLFVRRTNSDRQRLYDVFAPDLAKDPLLQFFERTYSLWLVGFAALLFLLGGWSTRPRMCGVIGITKRLTAPAICGGLVCWPMAKDGTTTIMLGRGSLVTAIAGGNWT